MDLARHCNLCDYQKISLHLGTTCALNDRKPEFNKACIKIALNEKFENKLKYVNAAYENLKRKKIWYYMYFVVFLIIGISVIIGGIFLGKHAYDHNMISSVPIIIIGVGLLPIGVGFGTLINYRQEIGVAKTKKDDIDEVLNLYGITYEVDILFGKEIHDVQDVHVVLKIKGIR